MQNLKDILYKVALIEVNGNTNINISSIVFDSRKITDGCLFIALKGTQKDGHQFIEQAVQKGATAIVCEQFPNGIHKGITYIQVKNSSESLGIIANNFFGNPSSKLKLVGVTGTNGKTTIATLLFQLFSNLGFACGLISTIQYQIKEEIIPSSHTTPDAVQLNQLLQQMVESGCEYCFMEVSSHAVVQHRISGLNFSGAIFSNISHDHLDYHKTFDEYIKAKKLFFDNLNDSAFALTNIDDRNGKVMVQNTKATVSTYSINALSDFRAKILENDFTGLVLNMDEEEVHARLIGEFNSYNLLAIYGAARLLNIEKQIALKELSNLQSVEGRFDYVLSEADKIVGIVDYAHTPDALQKTLSTINSIRTRNEKLIAVLGCGGDRDKSKRPIMAEVASELSDKVILTSDNPRTENPDAIIEEMKNGIPAHHFKKSIALTDRAEAIKLACSMAEKGDIILVAGKGHEKYQEINGVKYPFDDKQILLQTFKKLNK